MFNVVFRNLISRLSKSKVLIVMHEFENWCGLPNIHGAIDETQIAIFKPFEHFAKD